MLSPVDSVSVGGSVANLIGIALCEITSGGSKIPYGGTEPFDETGVTIHRIYYHSAVVCCRVTVVCQVLAATCRRLRGDLAFVVGIVRVLGYGSGTLEMLHVDHRSGTEDGGGGGDGHAATVERRRRRRRPGNGVRSNLFYVTDSLAMAIELWQIRSF
ncbi:hypothetical protein KSP39_PZI015512 [Platanthera zijinensis]|uniref:Uncharacterized protein n=1 Tax=Platanthera zijinensis TaxID=2320716 RepID=A0AAP0B8J2_9ASPA